MYRNLWLGHEGIKNIVIVGRSEEAARVERLLTDSHVKFTKIGYVIPEENEKSPEDKGPVLGSLKQLGEIVTLYPVDEIVFCASDIPSQTIISWMVSIQDQGVDFKIAPEERLFIIGSHSKNMPGDFYTIEIKLAISNTSARLTKYLLDAITALLLLVTSPFYIWLMKAKKAYLSTLFKILMGKLTWVGYHESGAYYHLPAIRKGVFSPINELPSSDLDQTTLDRLNFLYARDYSVEKDLKIIAQNLPFLTIIK
jgi:hypothetical protein